jgi:fructokinase
MTIACFGELLIDFVALESGVSVGEASGFIKAPGGAPANVAVAMARLGHPAAFLGQVGDDPFGHHLAGVLAADGVDIAGLRYNAIARTALAFVALGRGGERSFSFYRNPSADMLMRPEDVALDVIARQRIFHFGSVTMIGEPSRSATLAAADHARAHDLIISYDPNLRMALWPSAQAARDGMLLGFEYAHVVKVSDEELEFLTGGTDARALWRPQMQLLAVTRGADGATLYTADQVVDMQGFAVEAVDTTGAGDGFMAGMLSGVLELGDDMHDRLVEIARYACAVGALTTTVKGAIPALPTRARVLDFLSRAGHSQA